MKKTNHQRTNIMTIRLTALLVAVVFVLGTMFIPTDLYAAENETGEAQAAAVEETATEPAGPETEETEPVLTEESEAEAVDAAEQEATEVVAEESEEAEETTKRRVDMCPEEWQDSFGDEFYDYAMDNSFYFLAPRSGWNAQAKSVLAPGFQQVEVRSQDELLASIDQLKQTEDTTDGE